MRTWKLTLLPLVATALCVPATASAAFMHVVAPGESLSSVAAADGLSVSQLAAANGVSTATELIAGSSLAIPAQTEMAIAPSVPTETAAAAPSTEAPVASSSGGYLVQPGDTLSAIAARYGVGIDQLASANGLDPAGLLLAGSSLSVSGAPAPAETVTSQPVSEPVSTGGGAQPTAETVSSSEVGSIAAENGVSPSLAEAIGYQESGFNNDEVSSSGATGVMQIEPGTWNYIGQNLATPPPLSPASATDNIRGGVLLLHSLLDQTGGDPALAAAGYYQGIQSVREHGLFSDTQQYVNDVMALRGRFGG
jgi:soluble lytic murein transglycosylase-like protein